VLVVPVNLKNSVKLRLDPCEPLPLFDFQFHDLCITSSASRHLSRLSNTRSVFTGCVPKTIITSIHFIVLSPPGTGPARFDHSGWAGQAWLAEVGEGYTTQQHTV